MPVVRVYSRPDCHLCELLIEELLPEIRGKTVLEVLNVADEARLEALYGTRVPVVEVDGRFVCQYKLDPAALDAAILRSAALNSSS